MRLVIDARMLEHSGIGTYLTHALPGVLRRCAALRPLVLTLPALVPSAAAIAGTHADVLAWNAQPLTAADALPPPAGLRAGLWWSPHINVPMLTASPLVVTVHDLLPLSEAFGWRRRLVYRTWLHAVRRRARRVVCVSASTQRELVRRTGIAPARTRVVHLGVDRQWHRAEPAAVADAPYIVFVGLVKPHKNLMTLLRAFQLLMPVVPHRLVVVGRHHDIRGADHDALAFAHALGSRVVIHEAVPQESLVRLVAGADLLVQPSFHEGFGLPPLEAMAAGTPVLAAGIDALREVCGDAAAYCDPHSAVDIGAAIRRILDDPGLRAGMRGAGRERARTFTWEACADATSEVLLEAWEER